MTFAFRSCESQAKNPKRETISATTNAVPISNHAVDTSIDRRMRREWPDNARACRLNKPFFDGMGSTRNFHADKELFARENSIETRHLLRSNESAKNVMRATTPRLTEMLGNWIDQQPPWGRSNRSS
jgi:hypothetical protein